MSEKITHDEWIVATPPFFWLSTNSFVNRPPIVLEMVEKWLIANTSSWWWRDGITFIFSSKEDRVTFKFWLLSGVFDTDDYGDIE